MADSKVSALAEATVLGDDDEILVNDSGTSKRATVATVKTEMFGGLTGLSATRLVSSRRQAFTLGPWSELTPSGSDGVPVGGLVLGWSYVRGGTPTSVAVSCASAGSAGDEMYYVLYNHDANGLPTTLANSWGPFDVASTGTKTLTGQTETVVAGWYWVGVFGPTANTGVATFEESISAISPVIGVASQNDRRSLKSGDTSASTPPDVSSFTAGGSPTSSAFEVRPYGTTVMFGWTA